MPAAERLSEVRNLSLGVHRSQPLHGWCPVRAPSSVPWPPPSPLPVGVSWSVGGGGGGDGRVGVLVVGRGARRWGAAVLRLLAPVASLYWVWQAQQRSGPLRWSGVEWPCGGSGKSAGPGRPPCRGVRPAPQDGPHESPRAASPQAVATTVLSRHTVAAASPDTPRCTAARTAARAIRDARRSSTWWTSSRTSNTAAASPKRTTTKSNHRSLRTQMAAARRRVMATTTATSQGASGLIPKIVSPELSVGAGCDSAPGSSPEDSKVLSLEEMVSCRALERPRSMNVPIAKITAEAKRNRIKATRSGSREDLIKAPISPRYTPWRPGLVLAASVRTRSPELVVPAPNGHWRAPGFAVQGPMPEGAGSGRIGPSRGTDRTERGAGRPPPPPLTGAGPGETPGNRRGAEAPARPGRPARGRPRMGSSPHGAAARPAPEGRS